VVEGISGEATATSGGRGSGSLVAGLTISGVAALLGFGFLPAVYSHVSIYDDDGYFLATLRQFLDHGGLYSHVRTEYGPFYFSFMAAVYRLIGHSPDAFTGRLIVLCITAVSVGMFAATVWRATRSLAFSVLCEIVTFGVLIVVAGAEAMHPGTLLVLLLSVLTFALVSYAQEPKTRYLAIAGVVVGAMLMTKINVGLFAVAAIVIVFVVGNREFPRWFRTLVAIAGLLLPFFIMSQLLYQVLFAEFALLVSLSLALMYVPMRVDEISLPRRALLILGGGAVGGIVLSCVWPLATGTSPAQLVSGILLRPLRQANILAYPPPIALEWFPLIITLCAVLAMLHLRADGARATFGPPWLPNALLGVAALGVLGLAVVPATAAGQTGQFLAWLPAIVVIPVLAWMAAVPAQSRLALRFLVPLAILQILHAYPVPGSQAQWGLVVMCVPCAIALAIAMQRVPTWQTTAPFVRGGIVTALGVVFLVSAGLSPLTQWHDYEKLARVGVPGARWLHLEPQDAQVIRQLTRVVRRRCDTFYAAPGYDSLYIYSRLPAPTGYLANVPGGLTIDEQRDLGKQINALYKSGKRVCILRDYSRIAAWYASPYGKGPLAKALKPYSKEVTRVSTWTVSKHR
jgi:4-amino-4-deoxy-L-arabinose transferase-like glycosyltransferase